MGPRSPLRSRSTARLTAVMSSIENSVSVFGCARRYTFNAAIIGSG
jgi:hypothetical protein